MVEGSVSDGRGLSLMVERSPSHGRELSLSHGRGLSLPDEGDLLRMIEGKQRRASRKEMIERFLKGSQPSLPMTVFMRLVQV